MTFKLVLRAQHASVNDTKAFYYPLIKGILNNSNEPRTYVIAAMNKYQRIIFFLYLFLTAS